MIVEFSVENFRSIRERVTLSMIAAKLRARDEQLDRDNVIEVNEKLALLRSAVIYGANASGKSNLLKAVSFMRSFVINSARLQEEDLIPVEPFQFDTKALECPSTFEIVFLMDGLQYRYGFSLTAKRVIEEWLYFTPTLREATLFTRDEEGIHIGERFSEARGLQGLDLQNKLFLSVVAQLNKESQVARRIREWFRNTCRTLTAVDDSGYLPYTMRCIESGLYHRQLEKLVRRLDLDITGLSVAEVPMPPEVARFTDALAAMVNDGSSTRRVHQPDLTSERTRKELRTRHAFRDENGKVIEEKEFPARTLESEGTQKLIALTGPLMDVLTHGHVLFLDEIDSRLHPLITAEILRLFHSPVTNPKNAQLICTTHDTNLLDRQILRRDQIYFVEKDEKAASHLYSLAEFKLETSQGASYSIRNDASFEKNYIQGRYGAIPYLGNLNRLFVEELQREDPSEISPASLEVEP